MVFAVRISDTRHHQQLKLRAPKRSRRLAGSLGSWQGRMSEVASKPFRWPWPPRPRSPVMLPTPATKLAAVSPSHNDGVAEATAPARVPATSNAVPGQDRSTALPFATHALPENAASAATTPVPYTPEEHKMRKVIRYLELELAQQRRQVCAPVDALPRHSEMRFTTCFALCEGCKLASASQGSFSVAVLIRRVSWCCSLRCVCMCACCKAWVPPHHYASFYSGASASQGLHTATA